ncbi:Phosphoglycerate mutase family protein [Listeria weihenstephanensis FSL R9-0317]|uniref:Phosphoglycerate mutase n=1 Tax=Listeria weihenstephanensis TaxID=1006155 RepID=A0A1S7FX21_9LIST|nr:histidine phosphatase family protein [Listeria weihenstephanensis]AQY51991.1 phosphoglycerate mutase [Listeria weihenstephanensis]EUJ40220.1 Phosphoglycerate mutase family protein [Listeria weihenstephanensis FSL R9-0317]
MTGKVTLYVTRHGKTMLNTTERVQGWADSPLTEAGILVAEQLGRGLADTKFEALYTSDRGRTLETADIVMRHAGFELPVNQLKGLREFGFGKFEGEYNAYMWETVSKMRGFDSVESFFEALKHEAPRVMIDAVAEMDETGMAENWDIFTKRLLDSMDLICSENTDGNVLVVCHGMVINILLSLLDPDRVDGPIENASVTKISYENGKYTVESANDMQYVERGVVKN